MSEKDSDEPIEHQLDKTQIVTKDFLQECLGAAKHEMSANFRQSELNVHQIVTEYKDEANGIKIALSDMESAVTEKLSNVPSKANYFFGLLGAIGIVLAFLAILPSIYNEGKNDGANLKSLEQSIVDNNKAISELIEIQRSQSKNLQTLVDGHAHRLEFKGNKPEN